MNGSEIIKGWPEDSREPAQLVIDAHGEPHEATESFLTWHKIGSWRRVVASRAFFKHEFSAPHIDAVESFIDYRVPVEFFTPLAEFVGSVIVERTAGEVSVGCHDEQTNNLALNLMHDIVTGAKSAHEARDYYAKEFADARRKKPTRTWTSSTCPQVARAMIQTSVFSRTGSSNRPWRRARTPNRGQADTTLAGVEKQSGSRHRTEEAPLAARV